MPIKTTAAVRIGDIPASALPATLNGLRVQPESDKAAVSHADGSYARAVGFYSLRQSQLVEATLEVIELVPSTPNTAGFRLSLVNQVTGGIPSEVRLSGHSVYLASGIGSATSTWFDGRVLFILTTRSQYSTPRALLEATLGVHLS
ncbi:MAG: hypothetical protein ACYCSJ_01535 [Acidimicrobiales bacterium]